MFYHDKLSKTTEAYYLELGLYSSKTEIVGAMNTREKNKYREQYGGDSRKSSIPFKNLKRSNWSRRHVFNNIAN